MKKIIVTLFLSMIYCGLCAQVPAKSVNTVSLSFGGGYHALAYKLDDCGDKKDASGFEVKLGYSHLFNPKVGISTGVMSVSFKTTVTLNYLQTIDKAIDEDNNTYTHRTYFHGLEECQKQNLLVVPVEFVYRQTFNRRVEMWLGAGLFGGFALNNKFSADEGNLETRRYYMEQNLEVYGDYPQHHLYTESGFNGKSSSKPVVGGIFEPNLIVRLAPNVDLHCGFYVLYSFTRQNKETRDPLYNPDCMSSSAYSATEYHGVLNSALIEKVRPFAVGMELGVGYRF